MPSSSSKPLLPFFFLVIVLLYCADAHRREVHGNDRIFDISHKYSPNMPSWGSNDGLGQFLWLRKSMKNGSIANSSEMKLPSHSGTHVDAPGHFYDYYFDAGFDVDTLDLEVLNANPVHPNSVHLNSAHLNSAHSNPAHLNSAHLNSAHSNPVHLNSAHSNPVPGPALLVDITRDKNITAEVMEALNIPTGTRRVLFRTLNTDRGLMYKKEYDTSYTGFTKDGAKWLVENTDIKLVGIDFLSVATDVDLKSAHLVFLESREIIIVEGLKLEDIQAGIYTLHCLPLRLLGAEGSPIRCILIK